MHDGKGGIVLEGRRALVTGAASGIGLAIATVLRESGATVVLADLPGERLEAAGHDLGGCKTIAADLGRREEVLHLAQAAGQIDILVNNAGFQHVSPIDEFPEERWDTMLAVMLTAPFLLTRHLLPGMYERGWGRVLNVASLHGLIASPYKSAYVAAKHGIIGFTKALGLEAGPRCPQVTAHAICPSYVRTPLVEGQIAEQARVHNMPEEEVIERVLLAQNAVKRLIEPAEVASAALWLCRDEAWTMTGSALTMDAGWLAH